MLYQLNLGNLAQAKGFIFLAPNFRCLGPWKIALVVLDILVCPARLPGGAHYLLHSLGDGRGKEREKRQARLDSAL